MECKPPCETAYIATAIAVELARGKTQEEIIVLRNMASQIAAVLLTMSSQESLNDKKCPPKT